MCSGTGRCHHRDIIINAVEMMARYTELNIKKAELKQASGSLEKADLGRYACVTELTRELLVELIKEIRVSGEDALEIVWNFKELTAT